MADSRPKRHLRTAKACDYCHRRRIKCRLSNEDPSRCQNCVDFSLDCGSTRLPRRGTRMRSPQIGFIRHAETSRNFEPPRDQPNISAQSAQPRLLPQLGDQPERNLLQPGWRAFGQAAEPVVQDLLPVFFETVYPIFPFFDRGNLEQRLSNREHETNRGFFCSIMAACALSSARVRDGALASFSSFPASVHTIPSETFFDAARQNLPEDMIGGPDFDSLRACAILSIASIQDVNIEGMHMYIGLYYTMMATWGWHDEANWPSDLSVIEKEERRRLYWSMYTLDIFTSIVWDSCIHFQEGHAMVQYPSGIELPATEPSHGSWIVGWNFTTDLYRRLEHVLARLRTRSSPFNMFNDAAKGYPSINTQEILVEVSSLYLNLPSRFIELAPATGELEKDIYGFQAANIQATLALFRIALLSLESRVDVDKKCSVASEVLEIFHRVPKAYQRAISTPLIYHMGGIGNILGSVIETPLSESSYQRVRQLLLSMASLLENLESFHKQQAGAGRKLQEQVSRIDDFMASCRGLPDADGLYDEEALATARLVNAAVADGNAGQGTGNLPDDLSPLFQIPDELLQNWDWTSNVFQSQFPYFEDNS